MECQCRVTDRLEGSEAADYVHEHLRLVSVDNDTWGATYRCPGTGMTWTETYPHAELHGGGPPLLVRDDPAT